MITPRADLPPPIPRTFSFSCTFSWSPSLPSSHTSPSAQRPLSPYQRGVLSKKLYLTEYYVDQNGMRTARRVLHGLCWPAQQRVLIDRRRILRSVLKLADVNDALFSTTLLANDFLTEQHINLPSMNNNEYIIILTSKLMHTLIN